MREALKKSGKVGLAKFVLRSAEHLGILKAEDDVILLIQIRFNQDLRDPGEAKIPNVTVTKKELDLALNMIDQMTDKFEPEKYKDTYKEDLLALIKKKSADKPKKKSAKDEEETAPKTKKAPKEDDLLEQLKASLMAMKN